jgi:hypothetical protein
MLKPRILLINAVLLAAILSAGWAQATSPPDPAEQHFNQGLEALKAGDGAQAVAHSPRS